MMLAKSPAAFKAFRLGLNKATTASAAPAWRGSGIRARETDQVMVPVSETDRVTIRSWGRSQQNTCVIAPATAFAAVHASRLLTSWLIAAWPRIRFGRYAGAWISACQEAVLIDIDRLLPFKPFDIGNLFVSPCGESICSSGETDA